MDFPVSGLAQIIYCQCLTHCSFFWFVQYICQEDLSLEMHLAQHGGYAPHHRTAGPEQADTPSVSDHETEGTQNIALLPTELDHVN